MDRHRSILNPRNLIICVTTCTIAVVWAVVLVTLYFYFFEGPQMMVIHNVTEVQAVHFVRQELLPWYLNGSVLPTTTPDDDMFEGPQMMVIHNVTEVQAVHFVRQELLPWYLNGSVLPTTTPDDDMFERPQMMVIHNVTEVQAVHFVRQELLPWYLNGSVLPTTTPDDDMVPLFTTMPPLTPVDRLRSQLMFLPKGNSETKIVLFWSDWSPAEVEEYKVSRCPINSCVFTNSRKSYEKASAVVFRNASKLLTDFPEEHRPRSQVWVFNSLSDPEFEFAHPRDVFNWSATPRLDSTVPMFPHGIWMYYNSLWKQHDPPMNKVEHKLLEAAAWFPSSCDVSSRAFRFVSLLSHHTLVDTFSSHPSCAQMEGVDRCPQGRWDICHKLLRDKYRVTLVLDTTMCNHTIPAMFYRALQANTVPVVMWPPRSVYEQLVPEGSFIHTDDFSSPRNLAWHLDMIYKDDALFNKYLSWQDTGLFVKTWYCRLCALLHHNNLPDMVIEDINQWWNPEGECTT